MTFLSRLIKSAKKILKRKKRPRKRKKIPKKRGNSVKVKKKRIPARGAKSKKTKRKVKRKIKRAIKRKTKTPAARKSKAVVKKRPAKKKTPARQSKKNTLKSKKPLKSAAAEQSLGPKIGTVTHFFSKIQVCVIKVTGTGFKVKDLIYFKGAPKNFTQQVNSIQVESVNVPSARKGQLVGLKVDRKIKEGSLVFKVR